MGLLRRFDLAPLIERHRLEVFVETGTGGGDSLDWACQFGFAQLLSCEIEPILAVGAIARFAGEPRAVIVRADSASFLRMVMRPELPPALVWLDAHFPGADFGLRDYQAGGIPEEIRQPLARELEILAARPGRDVILIDDLRLIEAGDYEAGPLPEGFAQPAARGADWIRQRFAATHEARVSLRDTGYLMLLPKGPTQ
jgi:hypothetical protein